MENQIDYQLAPAKWNRKFRRTFKSLKGMRDLQEITFRNHPDYNNSKDFYLTFYVIAKCPALKGFVIRYVNPDNYWEGTYEDNENDPDYKYEPKGDVENDGANPKQVFKTAADAFDYFKANVEWANGPYDAFDHGNDCWINLWTDPNEVKAETETQEPVTETPSESEQAESENEMTTEKEKQIAQATENAIDRALGTETTNEITLESLAAEISEIKSMVSGINTRIEQACVSLADRLTELGAEIPQSNQVKSKPATAKTSKVKVKSGKSSKSNGRVTRRDLIVNYLTDNPNRSIMEITAGIGLEMTPSNTASCGKLLRETPDLFGRNEDKSFYVKGAVKSPVTKSDNKSDDEITDKSSQTPVSEQKSEQVVTDQPSEEASPTTNVTPANTKSKRKKTKTKKQVKPSKSEKAEPVENSEKVETEEKVMTLDQFNNTNYKGMAEFVIQSAKSLGHDRVRLRSIDGINTYEKANADDNMLAHTYPSGTSDDDRLAVKRIVAESIEPAPTDPDGNGNGDKSKSETPAVKSTDESVKSSEVETTTTNGETASSEAVSSSSPDYSDRVNPNVVQYVFDGHLIDRTMFKNKTAFKKWAAGFIKSQNSPEMYADLVIPITDSQWDALEANDLTGEISGKSYGVYLMPDTDLHFYPYHLNAEPFGRSGRIMTGMADTQAQWVDYMWDRLTDEPNRFWDDNLKKTDYAFTDKASEFVSEETNSPDHSVFQANLSAMRAADDFDPEKFAEFIYNYATDPNVNLPFIYVRNSDIIMHPTEIACQPEHKGAVTFTFKGFTYEETPDLDVVVAILYGLFGKSHVHRWSKEGVKFEVLCEDPTYDTYIDIERGFQWTSDFMRDNPNNSLNAWLACMICDQEMVNDPWGRQDQIPLPPLFDESARPDLMKMAADWEEKWDDLCENDPETRKKYDPYEYSDPEQVIKWLNDNRNGEQPGENKSETPSEEVN